MTEQQQNTLYDITYILADREYLIKEHKDNPSLDRIHTIRVLLNTLEEAHGLIDELKVEEDYKCNNCYGSYKDTSEGCTTTCVEHFIASREAPCMDGSWEGVVPKFEAVTQLILKKANKAPRYYEK